MTRTAIILTLAALVGATPALAGDSAPDLVPWAVIRDDIGDLQVTVKNIGPVWAGRSTTRVRFSSSAGTVVQDLPTDALAPGATQTWTMAGGNDGNNVSVRVDALGDVNESIEVNNSLTAESAELAADVSA